MKFKLSALLILLSNLLWADLSLKYSKSDQIMHPNRGFSLVQHQDKTHIFSYTTLKKDYLNKLHNGLSYFKQLELNDNQTLAMRTIDNKNKRSQRQFNFFMGTKNIKARVVHDDFIFLAAQTSHGDLKIALLDKDYKLRLSQTIKTLSVEKIYKIFEHIDGSYSLALQISNHKNRLTYFNRGTGIENIAILKISSLLHLKQTHIIGDSDLNKSIEVLKDNQENYYLFNQNQPNKLTLNQHDFHKNSNTKKVYDLKENHRIQTISTRDYTTFYIGADQGIWMTLNRFTQAVSSYELANINSATIRTISKLDNNSLLISGNCRSAQGEEDLFIQNYSPYKSLLWEKLFHSNFNDYSVNHHFNNSSIFLTALINDNKNQKKVALFELDYQGKPVTYKKKK